MNFITKAIGGLLLGALLIPFQNSIVLAQEEDKEGLNLVPTEFPLVVYYIDKSLKPIDASAVEDILYPYEPLSIPLKRQDVSIPHGGGSIHRIEMKAFHNGEWVYFLFAWKDNTRDNVVIKHEQNRDAVAILFPLKDVPKDTLFSPRMGDIAKPVNIWHWKADWEEDLKGENSANRIEVQYPDAVLEVRRGVILALDRTAGGWGSVNLLSVPSRVRSVEDLNAAKFGTLTSQKHQDVDGHAVWSRGKWMVVMARRLSTPDKSDTQLYPGQKSYFSLAVWNGSTGDRNGQKSVSDRWHPLEIETKVK